MSARHLGLRVLGLRVLGLRALALALAATALIGTGCIKQKESLIIVALTADRDLPDATTVSISAGKATQVYAIPGLTQNTAVQRGIYLDSKTTGTVTVSATTQGGSPCRAYAKSTTVDVAAGALVNAALKLSDTGPCAGATDAASDTGGGTDTGAGTDAAVDSRADGGTGGRPGTGGVAGGTGGVTGGTGGVIVGTGGRITTDAGTDAGSDAGTVGGSPTLQRCNSYIHSVDTDCSSLTSVYGVAVSPNGQTVVTGGDDARAKIWRFDGRTLTPTGLPDLPSNDVGYGTLAFSPNGAILAIGWSDGIDLWNTTTWIRILHLDTVDSVYELGFTPDGQQVMSIDSATLYIHNINAAAPLHTVALASSTWLMAVSPVAAAGTTTAAVAMQDGTVRVFTHNAAGFTPSAITLVADSLGGVTRSVRFSPDGALLAAGNSRGQLTFWRVPVTTATPIAPIVDVSTPTTSLYLNWLAFSPDSRTIAVAGTTSKSLSTFAVTPPRGLIAVNRGVTQNLQSVAYSPNGTAILAGGTTCGYVVVCAD